MKSSAVVYEEKWRNRLAVIALTALSMALLLVYFLRNEGTVALVAAAVLFAAMEVILVYYVSRILPVRGTELLTRKGERGSSRLARRTRISESALREMAYSQRIMLQEFKTMIADRTSATRMISRREVQKRADSEGAALFGSELLLRVYQDKVIERKGDRLVPLPSEEFVEVFNKIVDDMRKRS